MDEAWVIGAGPAGLMAAEEMARAGLRVVVVEAKPSPARKFLMAGKSGLNLTKDEPLDAFIAAYHCKHIAPMVQAFGPEQVAVWSAALGQPVFTGSSGRVFPVAMKASPLLRAWLARLEGLGVTLRSRWRWVGFDGAALVFEKPEGRQVVTPRVTVLALGGASWPRLGSDAAWVPILQAEGVPVAALQPANMGFAVDWSAPMARVFGQAVKPVALMAGGQVVRGEFVISAKGMEGGGIYAVSRAMRQGAALHLDLAPDLSAEVLAERLSRMKAGETAGNRLRKLGLAPASIALVMEFGRGMEIVTAIKRLPVEHQGPLPMAEAISSAGGVGWGGVSEGLELKALPGVFVAGEMLNWEAPTGGYLLTGCLATGRWAGRAAAGAAG